MSSLLKDRGFLLALTGIVVVLLACVGVPRLDDPTVNSEARRYFAAIRAKDVAAASATCPNVQPAAINEQIAQWADSEIQDVQTRTFQRSFWLGGPTRDIELSFRYRHPGETTWSSGLFGMRWTFLELTYLPIPSPQHCYIATIVEGDTLYKPVPTPKYLSYPGPDSDLSSPYPLP